jgi:tRNA A-37 threonylcarbamoyl transferase component Bud32
MSIFIQLSALALRPLLKAATTTLNLGPINTDPAAQAIASWLGQRFIDQSRRLTVALERANEQAWATLEMALGGDGLFATLGRLFKQVDQKALADDVRQFLSASAGQLGPDRGPQFRRQCLLELRSARSAALLDGMAADPSELAQAAARLARFSKPEEVASADFHALEQIGLTLPAQTYPNLRTLLLLHPTPGSAPLLADAARYFLRRQIETDPELHRGLSWSHAQAAAEAQSRGFEAVETALGQWKNELQQAIEDLLGKVDQIHGNVLDIHAAVLRAEGREGATYARLKEIDVRLQRQGMQQGELSPRHSFSIRGDLEKQAVKMLLDRLRQLPASQQQNMPAALNGLAKLLHSTGDLPEAEKLFAQASAQVGADVSAAAEIHYNEYRTALEQRDWDAALAKLNEAVRLDPARFAPFPMEKYQIRRILGAGGFGVAFLCQDVYMDEQVVIKSLYADDLDRGIDDIFREVKLLRKLRHPHIVHVTACDFAASGKQRPYFVMDYFEGGSLQEWLDKNGRLELKDLLAIAIPTAEALQAAHAQGVLHRDIKPDNLLVALPEGQWQVKLIDFGLALRQQTLRDSTTSGLGQSVQGSSVAGNYRVRPTRAVGPPEYQARAV